MGTRYEDQPPEHWAGAASLDPTPVWKQLLLTGLLLLGTLLVVGGVAALSLATQLAAPPAFVPGNRVVLAAVDLPAVGCRPERIGAPLVAEEQAFWIFHVEGGEYVAVSAWWRRPGDDALCAVIAGKTTPGPSGAVWRAADECSAERWNFGPRGEPLTSPRGLDRYLVSMEGERVVVNVGRTIRGFGRTPQPTRSPS
ncbi:hypothetical protein BH18CHL2_BH18CHL2_05920 [soil metagenome]